MIKNKMKECVLSEIPKILPTKVADKFLYHITKIKYLDNILIEGLLINSNRNGFVNKSHLKNYYIKYGLQPIFLTNDINFIIKTQLTDNFIKDCCVLKIKVSSLKLEGEYDYLNENWQRYYHTKENMLTNISKYSGKTFICKENIKPNLIYERI